MVNRKDLRKMVEDPRYISGIFNYCDRWCERCPFTARCTVYAMEQDSADDPEAQDISNEKFWQKMHGIFEQTREMIMEMAQEQGIDLSAVEVSPEVERRQKRRKDAKRKELARQARAYGKRVDMWFKSTKRLFAQKRRTLVSIAKMDIEGADPEAEAVDLSDAVDVVRWYQHQIFVKLARALGGEHDEDIVGDNGETFPRDADGSAKVALIGIDRSIAAWGRFHQHFPEKADRILDLLLQLDRLRRQVEERFPRARAFKRPGFDDGSSPSV